MNFFWHRVSRTSMQKQPSYCLWILIFLMEPQCRAITKPIRQQSSSEQLLFDYGFLCEKLILETSNYYFLKVQILQHSYAGWKKCIPNKDLARFSCKILQINTFFCKTSCKEKSFLARFFQGGKFHESFFTGNFSFFIFIVQDFKLTTAL